MRNTLIGIVGEERVHPGEIAVDGVRPQTLVEPENTGEVAEILAAATREKWAVLPVGSGAALPLGNPPDRADILLSTRLLSGVTDYEPADLTVSAGAGCTLADLNAALAEHRQFLPWDPPGGTGRTLGGIAATGRSGTLRTGFGQPRDWVLGLEAVTGAGTRMESGGRVVKNVAGYDLTRLIVGSHGTLAVITKLNLKVRPVPATEMTGIVRSPDRASLWNLARSILHTGLQPVALEVVSAEGVRWSGFDIPGRADLLCVRCAGEDADVRQQMLDLEELATGHGIELPEQIGAAYVTQFWRGVADLPVSDHADIALKLSVPPTRLLDIVAHAEREFSTLMEEFAWSASPAFGTLTVLLGGVLTEERIGEVTGACERLRAACSGEGGGLTVTRAPLEMKRRFDVWGDAGSTADLMRATKTLFDPGNCLNPGRYIIGI